MTEANAPPIVVRLDTDDPITLDRALGAARKALLGGRASVLAVEIGPAGMNGHVENALGHWMGRNAATFRNQLEALVYVAPSWWAAIVLRLDLRWTPPPVPFVVVRSLEAGLSWVAARREARAARGPGRKP